MHTHTHTHVYKRILYIYIQTCTYIYIYTCPHIYTHTHLYTHTYKMYICTHSSTPGTTVRQQTYEELMQTQGALHVSFVRRNQTTFGTSNHGETEGQWGTPNPHNSPSRNHDSAAPRQHPLICTGAEPIHTPAQAQWRKQLLRMFGPELIRINGLINELIKTTLCVVSKNRAEFWKHDISERRREHFRGVLATFLVAQLSPKRGVSTQEFTRFLSWVSSQRRTTRSDVSVQT